MAEQSPKPITPTHSTTVPRLQRDAGQQLVTTEISVFSGPLPHPEILRQYEAIHAGTMDRILKMAENEQLYRQTRENRLIEIESRSILFGQVSALAIAVMSIGGGIYLLATGHNAVGLTTIITAVGALSAAYFYGQHQKRPKPPSSPQTPESPEQSRG